MPHLILEHSSNILEPVNTELLIELHTVLTQFDTFKIQDVKSRAIRHDVFCLAEGKKDTSFIHLQLAIMPGRSTELKKEAAQKLHSHLQSKFQKSITQLACSISVEIRELDKDTYIKMQA